MTGTWRRSSLAAVGSGLLMGAAFPPFPLGVLAAFAWIPLFSLLDGLEGRGRVLRWTYASMFAFNALTLYWTGGFVHGRDTYMMLAGALLLVAHPLLFSVPFVAWSFVRKRAGLMPALAAFPFFWVAMEYFHSTNQFAFPWLLLGNTQTYDLAMIQMASVTGVYGLSFLLAASNAAGYLLYRKLRSGEWRPVSPGAVALVLCLAGMQIAPRLYGRGPLQAQYEPPDPAMRLRIGVVQPDIDPFEKWAGHEGPQMETLLRMSESVADSGVDLLLWPETATPFYLLSPVNREWYARVRDLVERRRVPLLSGIPDLVVYAPGTPAPPGSKTGSTGARYETFNGSLLLQPGGAPLQKYAKVILVPFAEHVPYSEYLSALNAAQWNFGLGGWSMGRDSTIFRLRYGAGEAKFANFICYESVFPGYVASYVRNGAQFLTVVTNDSWWGNTSGAYQHERYAVLRAVENRRWVIQCANGGISSFVDPLGRVTASTALYAQAGLVGSIILSDERTFYTEHGDWCAQWCLAGAAAAFFGAIALQLFSRKGHTA